MGNAWTHRRHAYGRPQVCTPPPPPPKKTAQLTCRFTPNFKTMQEFEAATSDLYAENLTLGDFEVFTLQILTPGSLFTGPTTVVNKGLAPFQYQALEGPGNFIKTVQVTDTIGNICICSIEFQVTPFGGGPP